MPPRPEVVCLCGSLRFAEELAEATRVLTLAGVIVLAPVVLDRPSDLAVTDESVSEEQRTALGELHLRRIDLADRVLVVAPGGHLGESTRREVAYARTRGKPVAFIGPA